ncbi:MAG: O-acetylhomoserine aminocarboxypropyltransferase/cysteine synthase family protein [Bacillota bacterium]
MRFNTSLLHGKYKADEKTGATNVPIYQSVSFKHNTAEELEKIFLGSEFGYIYTRINNPTIEAFERRIAHLEKGVGAIACASGMAAITVALMNILETGDEVVSGSGIFGGTYSLFKELGRFGITVRYAVDNSPSSFEKCITDKTRAIFIETIGNPKLDVPDIAELAQLAHSHGFPLIVDSTVTTPYIIKPVELGADIVVHSTSKYINGSGNAIGGIIVDSGQFKWDLQKYHGLEEFKKFGPFVYLAKLRKGLFKDFGACISPFNAYLNCLGMETLGVRMQRVCSNAQALAEHISDQFKEFKVNYPGLPSSNDYLIAKKQFKQSFGAILTVRVGSKEKAFQVINSLKYAYNLANIGDVRTLVIHPASTIYATNTFEEKETMGAYEDLIRISVGIEDVEDLIEDFCSALENAFSKNTPK